MHKYNQNRSTSSFRQFVSFMVVAILVLQHLLIISPVTAQAAPLDVFFSEYIEGSSNNKALEIYNGTGSAINLGTAGYNVQMFFNGSVTAGLTINLAGTVANADVFVLAQSSAAAAILAQADQTNTSSWYNGDDAIVLRKGTTIIDVIGQVGFDPGTEWGTGLVSTADNTIRRKSSVETGDPNQSDAFDPGVEWDGFAIDIFGGLGSHNFGGGTPTPTPTITPTPTPSPTNPTATGAANPNSLEAGQTTLLAVTVAPGTNPVSSGVTVSGDLSAIGGSVSQAFFDNGTGGDTAANDNIFSYQATVAPATTAGGKTLPVSVADAQTRTASTSISLTIQSPQPPAATTLVISQIYGGGGNSGATYKNDFVEIFNNGSQTVTFSNWSVQYASASGTSWSRTQISGALQPGQYYLVQLAAGAGGTDNLPIEDATGTTNMSGTSGKVALVKNNVSLAGGCPLGDANLLDLVGYGGANCFEGAAPAPTLSNTTAAIRARSGCRDTDYNEANFAEAAPAPRNTASALNACPAGDPAPEVFQTTPASGATSAALTGNLTINFDEAVNAAGNWYQISCAKSGLHIATANAATGTSFTLDPAADFASNEVCTVTIFAAQVTDVDTNDPPDNMAADYAWSFTTQTVRDADVHLTLGNPSGATTDTSNENNYLMKKPEYALSYNRSHGTANWTSWHLDSSWLGSAPRQDDFRPDMTLPSDWYHVTQFDFSGSGFDRGHMTPSADRTATVPENSATFLMTNMVPQAPDNNQGPWADLENDTRSFLNGSINEAYVVSGGSGTGGTGSGGARTTIAGGQVTVPAQTWKVMMILPKGDDDVSRVTTSTRVIAIIMPNVQGIRNDNWNKYLVTVDDVEALTGYDFFSNVPTDIQAVIESGLDGANNSAPVANSQTVSTSEDTAVAVTLSATDANVNNVLTYTVVDAPQHGTLSGTGANLTYTPDADYNGADGFTFKASDGTAESNVATVSINISAAGDAPVLAPIGNKTVVLGDTLAFTATAADADLPADMLTFGLVGTVPAGASINPLTGAFSWMPDGSQFGQAYQITVQATDSDNLSDQETIIVTIEDDVAPAITINSPAQGANYALNQTVLADYNCSDPNNGSGIQSCTGSAANGAAIDTSSVGAESFTVTAIYRAGNQSIQTVNYTVGYDVVALFDQTKAHNSGSTIPIKLKLVDANGVNRSAPGIQLTAVRVDPGNLPAQSPGNSNPANMFSFDSSSQSYQYNLKSEKTWTAGTYRLIFRIAGDPVEHSISFNIR